MTEEDKVKLTMLCEKQIMGAKLDVVTKFTEEELHFFNSLRSRFYDEYQEVIAPYKEQAEELYRQHETVGRGEALGQALPSKAQREGV
jgi:hypothetical protein